MGEYAIGVKFYHVHIPVSLDKFNQIFLKGPSILYQCIVHIKIQKSQKRQIGLMFGLVGPVFSTINTVQFNSLQKQSDIPSDKLATLKTH
jgi:hypothetical protein